MCETQIMKFYMLICGTLFEWRHKQWSSEGSTVMLFYFKQVSDPVEHYLSHVAFESWSRTVALLQELEPMHLGHFRTKTHPLKITLTIQGLMPRPVITAQAHLWLSSEDVLGRYRNATSVVRKQTIKGWLNGLVSWMNVLWMYTIIHISSNSITL